jgi:CzcA family heavy metal efflux pump
MMRWIIRSSLRFRYIVVFAGAGLMVFGFGGVRDTPVDVFPEFAQPRVEIQTPSLGLSAAEVEQLVTVPLEQSLQGLPDLETIRSKSVPQLSSIQLLFERGTDQLHARQLVQERLEAVTPTLPTWSAPPFMIQPLSSTSRVMKIGLSSNRLSLIEMSTIAYWKIRARLLQVPGVANVPIWGERLQQMHVQVDPRKLRENGVSLISVMDTTADALDAGLLKFSEGSLIGTGGFVDTPNQRLHIRHVLPIATPADLARVTIEKENGKRLLLGDVATLVEDHQPLAGDAVINDGPGLMLIVEKLPWANTLDVTRGVEQAMDDIQPGLPGMEVDTTIFRPATFIELSLHNLTKALLIGALLVVLVLGAFLFEWRAAVISVVAIPLSLMAAALVLYARGATINVMVLAGFVIALGVVVDDAIIDVQNVVRRLRENRREGSRKSAFAVVLEASLEVRGPIVYATLIIVAAMVPIFFLTGLTGAFFQPLAFSYVLAVGASLVVALTVTPALCLMLLPKSPLRRESPFERWLERGYERALQRIIPRPRLAYVTVVLTVAAGLAVTPFLGQSLLPSFKERDFLMHWLTSPDTSGPEETRVSIRACRELREIPGVRNCGSHIGQALLMDEVVGVYFGENWISVDPKADYDATLARVQNVVDGYPGIQRDVQTYLKERIREVLTGSSDAIVVRVFGDDLDVLRTKAEEVLEAIEGVDGLVEAKVELHADVPQVQVKVDLAAAQRYGIKPGDARRAAATWIASEEVGDIFRGGKAYDVHVWSTPETRHSLASIGALPLDTPRGTQVALSDLADVRIAPTPNVIERENISRRLDVSANVSGRDLGSVTHDIEERLEKVPFPLGYHAEVLGEFAERQAAQRSLLLFGSGGTLAIFLLLQAAFRSWRLATLAFLTLPMALVGGALAAFAGGGVLSLGSLVGFFTVFGIAARNGILMINHFQHLEQHEGESFGPKLVLRGARERLSPILMTTLATGLAIVPLVAAGNIPGHEIEHPLAVVVLGGLFTSTLLNLFVVPSLYLRFAKGRNAASRLGPGNAQTA